MTQLETLIQTLCPNGVKFVKLGDCCQILDSQRRPITKSQREAGEYPYYGANGIQDYVADFIFDGVFVLVGEDGSVLTPNGNPVVTWAEGKIWVNNHAHILAGTEIAQLRFLFYVLQTLSISHLVHGNIPKLTKKDLQELQIPLPPLAVQSEIVRILDKFTLYKSELAAELAARLQQYEYYRNQLLTFDDTVKRVKLGEVGEFIRGNGLQKKDFVDEGFPCIHYGQIHTYYGTFTTKTKSFVANPLYSKLKKAHTGDLIIATTSEDAEGVCKAVAWLGKEDVAVSGDAYIFRHSQNPKYMAYLFQTEQFLKYKKKAATGTKVVRVSGESMAKFEFPIPSLEVQERIVSILDRFDKLCHDIREGLPAEIDLRQKQYEHYRDKLLTFEAEG